MEDLIMKKIIMFVMVLVIGLTAGIANAALLASESFEYTAGTPLLNQDGGTGWTGSWEEEMENGTGATIRLGSLEHPSVEYAGNHVDVVDNVGNAEEWYTRELTTPLLDDGSTYWVSVVFQKYNDENAGSWCGFALGENIWFGKGYDMDNLVLWNNLGGDMETDVPATDLSLMVLKIETNPVDDEQVYLWVNPDPGAEPSTDTANANLEIALLGTETPDGADFFVLDYGASGTANSSDFKSDEIRIGTLFEDVIDYAPTPFIIDANDVDIYEPVVQYPLDSEGNFTVCLRKEPETGATVTVVIDPNGGPGGGNPDLTLIGSTIGPGDDAFDNRVYIPFTDSNWNEPQVVRFVAVHDEIPEPESEGKEDPHTILVSSSYPPHPTDANYVGEKGVDVTITDNDKADILFRVTPFRGGPKVPVTGPVNLSERLGGAQGDLLRWRKIGIQLQLQPVNTEDPCSPTSVKLNAVVTGDVEGDNLPPTDPCLPFVITDDPNCLTFLSETSSNGLPNGCSSHDAANWTTCWNVDLNVQIWGYDDDVLQAEGLDGPPEAEGDQNYQAVLKVYVIDDGGDERYTTLTEDAASLPGAGANDGPKTVQFNIEDNECGAFGILSMDVGNPNAATDPNYVDEDGNPLPDCYVNIYDAIELATKWLDCSDISDPSCESYL
jgi:hypothetical protein